MRKFAETRSILVTSPALLGDLRSPLTIESLSTLPTLTQFEERGEVLWDLVGPDGEARQVSHRPRLMCTSFDVLRASAAAGAGVTLLPDFVAAPALASGDLVHILPDWQSPASTLHAVFSSKRGLAPRLSLVDAG